MRALAKLGAEPCPLEIPSDLLEAKCIPPGFMVQSGWDIVCKYYQNVDSDKWIPYSVQMVKNPKVAEQTKAQGVYGTTSFRLILQNKDGSNISPWHDVSLNHGSAPSSSFFSGSSSSSSSLFNMVVEIPMYSTAKMEMSKELAGNPIIQDTKDNMPRYYTYGVPFFNYGFLPQTWEDPAFHEGDNDPIDVIELCDGPLLMGGVVSIKVLGALKLIDEGETDHKILAIRSDYQHFEFVNNMDDLEKHQPGVKDRLVDWLLNYKTSDGKPQNSLSDSAPTGPAEALQIISDVSGFYRQLVSKGSGKNTYGFSLPTDSFHSSSSISSSGSSTGSTHAHSVPKVTDTYGVKPV